MPSRSTIVSSKKLAASNLPRAVQTSIPATYPHRIARYKKQDSTADPTTIIRSKTHKRWDEKWDPIRLKDFPSIENWPIYDDQFPKNISHAVACDPKGVEGFPPYVFLGNRAAVVITAYDLAPEERGIFWPADFLLNGDLRPRRFPHGKQAIGPQDCALRVLSNAQPSKSRPHYVLFSQSLYRGEHTGWYEFGFSDGYLTKILKSYAPPKGLTRRTQEKVVREAEQIPISSDVSKTNLAEAHDQLGVQPPQIAICSHCGKDPAQPVQTMEAESQNALPEEDLIDLDDELATITCKDAVQRKLVNTEPTVNHVNTVLLFKKTATELQAAAAVSLIYSELLRLARVELMKACKLLSIGKHDQVDEILHGLVDALGSFKEADDKETYHGRLCSTALEVAEFAFGTLLAESELIPSLDAVSNFEGRAVEDAVTPKHV